VHSEQTTNPQAARALPAGWQGALATVIAEFIVIVVAMIAVRLNHHQSISATELGHFVCYAAVAVFVLGLIQRAIRALLPDSR
jgi:hypothetical protein